MNGLRTVHAIAIIMSGIAFALMLFGAIRPAIGVLTIVTLLLTWSLEQLRVAHQSRPENRS